MKSSYILFLFFVIMLSSCSKYFDKDFWKEKIEEHTEDPSSFAEIGSIDIGDVGAAEISAFDPKTNRLFVVNNSSTNKIDIIDLSNPASLVLIGSIPLDKYNGAVNSLDVKDGMLAAAVESEVKQQNGKAIIFRTSDYAELKVIPVGALPDMVTFSPDGQYILIANEGEPNSDYTNDPPGTVSIISVKQDFSVVNLDFSSFASQESSLKEKGLRMYGPGANFAQDMEPEYISVSKDSKTAWVTLQENNAIAKIDIISKKVTDILPLGFKRYSLPANAIDPSDKDGGISFRTIPVYGIYEPDAIAVLHKKGIPYLFTANEGDAREYDNFQEAKRIKDLQLDPAIFPDASELQNEQQLGRLNVTTTLGDNNNDGRFEALYSLGARSFSIWNGLNGQQIFDSKNNLEEALASEGFYDDGRSDDKGVEPEGLTIGEVGVKEILFVGMERADAVAVYDISKPEYPQLLNVLPTGDAPEGVLFIHKKDSPVKKSLLVISSENDGVIKVYTPIH